MSAASILNWITFHSGLHKTACLGISNSLYHHRAETEPSQLSNNPAESQTIVLCNRAIGATSELFFAFTTLPSKRYNYVHLPAQDPPAVSWVSVLLQPIEGWFITKLLPQPWMPLMVPYSCPIQDHKFRLLFTVQPSYLWNLMMQKFNCKYYMLKHLNLSHLFPHQSCSSFSILLVEELPTSESKGATLHGGTNWPRQSASSPVRRVSQQK